MKGDSFAECSVAAASRSVWSVGTSSGRVVFAGCWSGVGLVFTGADPSCRASVVIVVAVGSAWSVVGALLAMVARHSFSYASASKRNSI
mgnify:CR=1 FL=1